MNKCVKPTDRVIHNIERQLLSLDVNVNATMVAFRRAIIDGQNDDDENIKTRKTNFID